MSWAIRRRAKTERRRPFRVGFHDLGVPRSSVPGIVRLEATYLAWIDCRALGLDEAGLERFFAKEAKVGLNRGGMFGAPGVGWMRLNFGTSRSLVEEAVGRIEDALHRR